jgi:hypothetical protein
MRALAAFISFSNNHAHCARHIASTATCSAFQTSFHTVSVWFTLNVDKCSVNMSTRTTLQMSANDQRGDTPIHEYDRVNQSPHPTGRTYVGIDSAVRRIRPRQTKTNKTPDADGMRASTPLFQLLQRSIHIVHHKIGRVNRLKR